MDAAVKTEKISTTTQESVIIYSKVLNRMVDSNARMIRILQRLTGNDQSRAVDSFSPDDFPTLEGLRVCNELTGVEVSLTEDLLGQLEQLV